MLKLSVLDQSVATSDRTEDASIRQTLALAQHCEALGFHRFWVSEHHSHPSIVGSAPEVLMAAIAATTQRIRIGSAGVMLPHYSALKVAEQFRVLEALAPGRIDLGVGRAPGSDMRTARLLRADAHQSAENFPIQVRELQAWVLGVDLPEGHSGRGVTANPTGLTNPELWMLGSSDYGAQLAAHFGLPYAFAWFITDGQGADQALDLYRRLYRPSASHPKPQAVLCVWALAADTEAEAWHLFSSRERWKIDRNKGALGALPSPEEVAARPYSPSEQLEAEKLRRTALVGSGPQVAEKLRTLAERLEVDELVIITWTHDAAAQRRSYELLAREFFNHNETNQRKNMTSKLFSATIAGSLPKPAWLSETNKLWPQWKAEGAELKQAKADATLLWIKAQEDAGLDVIGDGEQSRQHFVHGFLEQVEGIDFDHKVKMGIRNNRYDAMVPQVVSELKLKGRVHATEAQLLRAHTAKKIKFTLPGPMTIVDTVSDQFYGDRVKMAMAFAELLNQEALALQADGVDIIQFDEPAFNVYMKEAADWGVAALEVAAKGLTCTTAVHICYGYGIKANNDWKQTLGEEWRQYEQVLPALAKSSIQQVSLECYHSHVPPHLMALLEGKDVMVGVIDVASDEIETPEQIADTIGKALQYVPKNRLLPCTNCGLAPMDREIAVKKLQALAQGAALARERYQ